ncbi:uncharacterized protein B0H64DRAFT_376029 [Chaetomium fimeti]|uniref:Uncharacterized protein n=1 Tax=Chaetomium fimeti TaxID=1854472 RepID=A0AAE0LQ17_9PEZI|nr:hypothetical protein B0H64DRAFT_376029 [Chaetomium fimeti]
MPQRNQPARLALLFIELVFVATALGVFAHGHATGLRTALWSTGGEHGWNSNPRLRIYFYANYQQPPEVPFLWTERCSESLLAVALVNITVWLVKLALLCCDFNIRLLSAFYHVLMSGLWLFCVNAQSSSDLSDPEHLSLCPWYLEKSCSALSGKDGRQLSACYLHLCFGLRTGVGSIVFFINVPREPLVDYQIVSDVRLLAWEPVHSQTIQED